MSNRALAVCVRVALVGMVLGLGGATLAASAGDARLTERPRTLLAGNRRIYAFVLGERSLTWISRTHMRGRYPGCEMYVRVLGGGRTSRAPLPGAGCGRRPPRNFAAQAPVLASGVAAWVRGSSCGNNECSWEIAAIHGGDRAPELVEAADVGCDYTCDSSFGPRPALAGGGNLLVYSAAPASDSAFIDRVRRIVGRHSVRFAAAPEGGDIESLVVGGGSVEAVTRVLNAGDGCGCLDSPVWSPDGSKIAYLHGAFSNQQVDPYPPHAALAVMNVDGSGRLDLTAPADLYDASFSWSPNGKQIAYVIPSGGTIAVVNADGSGSHQLGPGYDPAWSPDGSRIAFASAGCSGTTAAISVMNADGANAHQIASLAPGPTCLDTGGMAWSPDGTRIAFSVNGMLEVVNGDGSNVHPLGGVMGNEPAWSPDGSQIVFHEDSGLWEIGVDGSALHKLTDGPDEHPSWSPNGQAIVFGSDRNDPYANAHELYDNLFPELYLVASDGSNLRPLSFTKPSAFEQQKTFYSASGKPLPSLPGVPVLAGHIAAVGSTSPSGVHEITLFDTASGKQLAAVQVGASHGRFAVVGADARWVVYQVGRRISALNVTSHQVLDLTTAAAKPRDLSVSGRRAAWAENIDGHGRIRIIDLPS
jgi:TolB protein